MSARETPEHQCRQGRRCKARVKDDEGEFHGAGVEDAETLCRPCEFSCFEAIRKLGTDYDLLAEAARNGQSVQAGPKVSGSRERPIPLPVGIDALITDIDNETTRWALRITRGESLPRATGESIHRCVTILSAALGTLIDLPAQSVTVWIPQPDGGDYQTREAATQVFDGVDAVLRLSRLHQRAQSMLGLTEVTAWLNESCHVCGLRMLTTDMRNGVEETLINCRNCRNVWHQADFARLNNPLLAA